jgi:predicted nucleotidyltransferase
MLEYGLKAEHRQKILSIIGNFGVVDKVVLFGSRAMGKQKRASDVDIALFGDGVDYGLACAIKFEIEEGTAIPFFFDVVAYPLIKNERLKEHIDTKGVVLWEKASEAKNV